MCWQATWTQAMTDFRGDDEEQPFTDVTESRRTDPIDLTVRHGDDVGVDLCLPELTPYATANGFRFRRATTPGDFAGSREFPAPEAGTGLAPGGTGWSLPSGGPFLTHVVLAHASNDIGLSGEFAPLSELPSAVQQIDAYQQLHDRARAAGLGVILATITPMAPEQGDDPGREQIRVAVNDWIWTSGLGFVDFDETIRSGAAPSRIAAEYDAGDHQHPTSPRKTASPRRWPTLSRGCRFNRLPLSPRHHRRRDRAAPAGPRAGARRQSASAPRALGLRPGLHGPEWIAD